MVPPPTDSLLRPGPDHTSGPPDAHDGLAARQLLAIHLSSAQTLVITRCRLSPPGARLVARLPRREGQSPKGSRRARADRRLAPRCPGHCRRSWFLDLRYYSFHRDLFTGYTVSFVSLSLSSDVSIKMPVASLLPSLACRRISATHHCLGIQ
jgi:hypothetical protein